MPDDQSSDTGKDKHPDFLHLGTQSSGDKPAEAGQTEPPSPKRRNFLERATGLVAGAGVSAAAWPFISSMNPSADVISKGTVELDVSGIATGDLRTVQWRGKPIFVLHRTEDQIAAMEASQGGKDPQADKDRVHNSQWLILVGICTHLGCVPNRVEKGWLCPCHGSVYDDSGRILHGPAPRNLEVPAYKFVDQKKLVIGEA